MHVVVAWSPTNVARRSLLAVALPGDRCEDKWQQELCRGGRLDVGPDPAIAL